MAHRGRNKRRGAGRKHAAPKKTLDLNVKEIGAQGDGVCEHEGRIIHVPYTLPNEAIKAEVQGSKGRLLEVLAPAAVRTEPFCSHYGASSQQCGGCLFQHMEETAYDAWKLSQVEKTLRVAGISDFTISTVEKSPLRSRRRAAFAFSKNKDNLVFGYHPRQSDTVFSLKSCDILCKEMVETLPLLKNICRIVTHHVERVRLSVQLTHCENGFDLSITGNVEETDFTLEQRENLSGILRDSQILRLTLNAMPSYEKEVPIVKMDGVQIPLPAGAFLQATKEGERALQKIVAKAVDGQKAAVDLFGGIGTFSYNIAKHMAVHIVEDNEAALKAASRAIREDTTFPLTTEKRDLFMQPLRVAELNKYQLVIIDPPRAGAPEQIEQLAISEVPTIVSISCNPKTFARDAKTLMESGYKMGDITLVDQFLYSPHIEIACIFSK